MSKLHRRFEPLEPRFLLSGTGFVDGSFAAVRTQTTFSPPAAYSPPTVQLRELPVAEVEDRAEEFLSPKIVESPVSPPVVERLLSQESSIDSKVSLSDSKVELSRVSRQVIENSDVAATEVEVVRIIEEVKIVTPSSRTQNPDPVVVIEPAVSQDPTFSNGTTFAPGDVAVKEPVSTVSDDTTLTSNITRTLVDDRISLDKPLKAVAVRTSPTPISPKLVAITESSVAIKTSDGVRSLNYQKQPSRTEAGATANVVEDRKPTATDQGRTDLSATDGTDKQEPGEQKPGKDEGLAETDSCAAGSELLDTHRVWLAVVREPDTSEKTASLNAASNDPDAKLYEQKAAEGDRTAAAETQATVATSSPTVSRHASSQADNGNPFAKAADRVFSEEQSESGGRWATSRTLPPAEGALLLVTLGKPLTRLVTGDGRADVANVDCGLPGARTTFDRSRRNRRKTAEAQDRWQRRGDARDLTWLPPEKLPTDISHEPTDSAPEQTGDLHMAAESIPSRLADEVIFSHLDVTEPEDRSKPSGSWLPTLPSSDAWDSYGILGGAAIVTLTGTISVLAVDRHRRMHKQPHRVNLPAPAYTGRTLARG